MIRICKDTLIMPNLKSYCSITILGENQLGSDPLNTSMDQVGEEQSLSEQISTLPFF